jgi:hypothetical protein
VARAGKAAIEAVRDATIAATEDFGLERGTGETVMTGRHARGATRSGIAPSARGRNATGPNGTAAADTSGEAGPTRTGTGVAGAPNVGAATAAPATVPGKSEDAADRARFVQARARGTEQETDARRARGLVAAPEATLLQANDLARAAGRGRSGHHSGEGPGAIDRRSAAGRGPSDRHSAVARGRIAAHANVRGATRRHREGSGPPATSDLFGPVAARRAKLPRPLTTDADRLTTSAIWSSRMRRSSPAGVR